MSFDKETRNALSKMVATCRRLLTEDVTDQLRGRFGMHPDGTILAIDRLDLAEDEKAAAESLRELHDHFYRPLGEAEIEGFVTAEQLSADEAAKRDFKPMPKGLSGRR